MYTTATVGAFFNSNAIIPNAPPSSNSFPISVVGTNSNNSVIGSYTGGFMQADVATILHEYAHTLGLNQPDGPSVLNGS
jgi:hypothetical protein